jgi:hypothetical protein
VGVPGSQLAQESVGDRAGAVGSGTPALDQHGEGQVATVADEPCIPPRASS